MKHLALIQTEFIKSARNWDDLSYDEQKGYLSRHPKTKRKITARPDSNNEVKNQDTINNSITNISDIDVSQILPSQKDIERVENLQFRGSTFHGSGAPWASEASKMAKLIKDPIKLIRRAKAVAQKYGTYDYYPETIPPGRYFDEEQLKEQNVWKPFAEALTNMGFSYDQIKKIAFSKSNVETELSTSMTKKQQHVDNSKLNQTARDLANTLAKKMGSQNSAPTSIDDFVVRNSSNEINEDVKIISTTLRDPIYAAKISIHNTAHWNPIHRNTINWLEKHPEDAKNYSESGTIKAKELIEGYKRLITENNEEISNTEQMINDLNIAVQDSLSQTDLSSLKNYHLAVITPNRRQSYFLFSTDKEKLQAFTKTKEGSKKIINPSKINNIMGTISPYSTALAVLKLKDEIK
jgi:hypothetical protein